MISWVEGLKRGVSTRSWPDVSNRTLCPSWSMMARRLTRLSFGPDLVDEHDARVEIALLAGDPLIDRVGDEMADAARILGPGEELLSGQLLAGEHVPQPELGLEPAVAVADSADDQGLGIESRANPRSAAPGRYRGPSR